LLSFNASFFLATPVQTLPDYTSGLSSHLEHSTMCGHLLLVDHEISKMKNGTYRSYIKLLNHDT